MKQFVVIVGAGVLAACTAGPPGPPDLVVDRTPCSHCGMLISEPIYAAAFQQAGTEARIFDDIGCLLAGLRGASARPAAAGTDLTAGVRFWFHDATTGRWIDGASAVFVRAPGLRTPMGGGVMALATQMTAARAVAEHNGEVVPTLTALLARTGERK